MDTTLKDFIEMISNRVISVNNHADTDEERSFMRNAVLDLVEIIQNETGYHSYSNDLFDEARYNRDEAKKKLKEREWLEKAKEAKLITDSFQDIEDFADYIATGYFDRCEDTYEFVSDQKRGYEKALQYALNEMEIKYDEGNSTPLTQNIIKQMRLLGGRNFLQVLCSKSVYRAAMQFENNLRMQKERQKILLEKEGLERKYNAKAAQCKKLEGTGELLQEATERLRKIQIEKEQELNFCKSEYDETLHRQMEENRQNEELRKERSSLKRKQNIIEREAEKKIWEVQETLRKRQEALVDEFKQSEEAQQQAFKVKSEEMQSIIEKQEVENKEKLYTVQKLDSDVQKLKNELRKGSALLKKEKDELSKMKESHFRILASWEERLWSDLKDVVDVYIDDHSGYELVNLTDTDLKKICKDIRHRLPIESHDYFSLEYIMMKLKWFIQAKQQELQFSFWQRNNKGCVIQ